MPIDVKNKTEEEILKEVAREVGKGDLEYNDAKTEKTVAVYVSIPFGENIMFEDGSPLNQGDWVYMLEDFPRARWIVTVGAVLRFIETK